MATKIKPATLTVNITEQITLNGLEQGAQISKTIASINEITHRIMNIPTSSVNIVEFGTANERGKYNEAKVKYIRLSNLDDTNYITLRITGDASTDFSVRLDKGSSFLITSDHASITGVMDYADITGVALEDLDKIAGIANSVACNLDIFVACI